MGIGTIISAQIVNT